MFDHNLINIGLIGRLKHEKDLKLRRGSTSPTVSQP